MVVKQKVEINQAIFIEERVPKRLGIQISEGNSPFPIQVILDHAIYIGRELQRAEQCLITGKKYIQD